MLEFAFGSYHLHRVSASVEPRNAASVRVLERLGMRKEAQHSFVNSGDVRLRQIDILVSPSFNTEWL